MIMNPTPDFTRINYDDITFEPAGYEQWRQQVEAETGLPLDEVVWKTNEQLDIKLLYTAKDIAGLEHLPFMSGIAAVFARDLSYYVCEPPLDHSPICRLLHRGGEQRLLPPQPGRRAERVVRRF
jgi:hypothetical protein